MGKEINRNWYIQNPKGQIDGPLSDRFDIKKGKYRPDIYSKDKHEYKTEEVEMNKRTEHGPGNFIGSLFVQIKYHSKIYKRGDKKPDNPSLKKFVKDSNLLFTCKYGSKDNKCEDANSNDL